MFNSLHKARNPSIVARGLLTEQGQCVSLSCCVVFAKVSTQCAVLWGGSWIVYVRCCCIIQEIIHSKTWCIR